MKTTTLPRVFDYNGLRLNDLDPTASAARIKDLMTAMYPELATAEVQGPEVRDNQLVYTFKRSAGTKGEGTAAIPFVQRLSEMAQGRPDPCGAQSGSPRLLDGQDQELMQLTARFRQALTVTGTPTTVPVSAIALML